jgi:hypothetical protein
VGLGSYIVGCYTVQSLGYIPTFPRNMLPQSSVLKVEPACSSEIFLYSQKTYTVQHARV